MQVLFALGASADAIAKVEQTHVQGQVQGPLGVQVRVGTWVAQALRCTLPTWRFFDRPDHVWQAGTADGPFRDICGPRAFRWSFLLVDPVGVELAWLEGQLRKVSEQLQAGVLAGEELECQLIAIAGRLGLVWGSEAPCRFRAIDAHSGQVLLTLQLGRASLPCKVQPRT